MFAGRRRSFAAGLPSVSLGREIGGEEVVYCVRGGVAKLGGLSNRLMDQQRGREKRGKVSPGRKTTAAALPRIELGRGRRGVAEAGAGKEELGAALL